MERSCGMLLPVFSLPSKYGIGAFSKEAYRFVDQLQEAGQSVWQILPLGPTGYGDSPYQSFSAFAGNPYFIDLEQLVKGGFLTEEECENADFGDDERDIDYAKLYKNRFPLLRTAYARWREKQLDGGRSEKDLKRIFKGKLSEETREYCFYMAVKNSFDGKSWDQWDDDIRLRSPKAVRHYRKKLADEIMFYEFQQYLFQKQWKRLKAYANGKGIQIVGDIPIYVAVDGADAWAHPELFRFDKDCRPSAVAGCPPDAFSATGQLWGNPLYDWGYHKKTKYSWWMKRLEYSFELYDVVRIDHFRGFEAYYAIPAGDETAEFGQWEKGPGYDFFKAVERRFGKVRVIAEDLGFLTPSVLKLVDKTGYPGMKVLEFAFDDEESNYLPHKYPKNCVVYTGTHDNNTLQGWYQDMDEKAREFSLRYLSNERTPRGEMHWDFIRLAMSSVADLAVIPVQDYLGLGAHARINEPSTLGKNWRWRMTEADLTADLIGRCRELARTYGRCGAKEN